MNNITKIYSIQIKARTFDSITTIEDKIGGSMKDFSQFMTKLALHNKDFIKQNPPKLLDLAKKGLFQYEKLLEGLIEIALPVNGKAYKPSHLETQLINELERDSGHLNQEAS